MIRISSTLKEKCIDILYFNNRDFRNEIVPNELKVLYDSKEKIINDLIDILIYRNKKYPEPTTFSSKIRKLDNKMKKQITTYAYKKNTSIDDFYIKEICRDMIPDSFLHDRKNACITINRKYIIDKIYNQYKSRFYDLSKEYILDLFKIIHQSEGVISGSSLVYLFVKDKDNIKKNFHIYDVDIFVLNNKSQPIKRFLKIYNKIDQNYAESLCYNDVNVKTDKIPNLTNVINYNGRIQLIEVNSKKFKSVMEYINNEFDLNCCKIAFDGIKFLGDGINSNTFNLKTKIDKCKKSQMLYNRLAKYVNRGFTITNIKEYIQMIEDAYDNDPWIINMMHRNLKLN